MAFDTLSYARRLRQAGMPEAQAEAVAEATRDAIAADAATKADSERLEAATKAQIANFKHEIAIKAETADVRHEIAMLRTEMKNAMAAIEARMIAAVESLVLRLTIRLGGLIAVGAAVIKL
jgi:hypothetical protein